MKCPICAKENKYVFLNKKGSITINRRDPLNYEIFICENNHELNNFGKIVSYKTEKKDLRGSYIVEDYNIEDLK